MKFKKCPKSVFDDEFSTRRLKHGTEVARFDHNEIDHAQLEILITPQPKRSYMFNVKKYHIANGVMALRKK